MKRWLPAGCCNTCTNVVERAALGIAGGAQNCAACCGRPRRATGTEGTNAFSAVDPTTVAH
eukprot:7890400-Lingulodinium_polyedra.AAC.1